MSMVSFDFDFRFVRKHSLDSIDNDVDRRFVHDVVDQSMLVDD